MGVAPSVCASITLCIQAASFSVEDIEDMAKIYLDLLQSQIDIYVTGVHVGGQICLMKLIRGLTCKSEMDTKLMHTT